MWQQEILEYTLEEAIGMPEPEIKRCVKCGTNLFDAPKWQTHCKPCYAQMMRDKETGQKDAKEFMPAKEGDNYKALLERCIGDTMDLINKAKDVEGAVKWKSDDIRAMVLSLFIQRCRDGGGR
jgi:hypothetical protein